MNLAWVKPFLIRGRHWAVKNAPHILMAMGTGGSITAVIFAAKATPAAVQAKKDAEFEKSDDVKNIYDGAIGIFKKDMERLTPWETVKACGKYYIPAVGMELFSLMCFWGAHGIDVKRQAVLAGLYSTAEQALIEYQKKVVEMIGEKPEREIRSAIAQDRINANPPPKNVFFESDVDCWCYYGDREDGYKFRSNIRKIRKVENDANYEMIHNMYLSEAELLWMFDPDHSYIVPSNRSQNVGWSVDRLISLDIDAGLTADDQPALFIRVLDNDGTEYYPQPGFSKML